MIWKCPACQWPNDYCDHSCLACGEKRCEGCGQVPASCWACEVVA